MIWKNGWMVVWCKPDYHQFFQIIHFTQLFVFLFINSFPQTSSDDLYLFFCLILILCVQIMKTIEDQRQVLGVEWLNDIQFFQLIRFTQVFLFYSSFSSYHPGAKWLVQHSIPSPRPSVTVFPSVWFLFYALSVWRARTSFRRRMSIVWRKKVSEDKFRE